MWLVDGYFLIKAALPTLLVALLKLIVAVLIIVKAIAIIDDNQSSRESAALRLSGLLVALLAGCIEIARWPTTVMSTPMELPYPISADLLKSAELMLVGLWLPIFMIYIAAPQWRPGSWSKDWFRITVWRSVSSTIVLMGAVTVPIVIATTSEDNKLAKEDARIFDEQKRTLAQQDRISLEQRLREVNSAIAPKIERCQQYRWLRCDNVKKNARDYSILIKSISGAAKIGENGLPTSLPALPLDRSLLNAAWAQTGPVYKAVMNKELVRPVPIQFDERKAHTASDAFANVIRRLKSGEVSDLMNTVTILLVISHLLAFLLMLFGARNNSEAGHA